MPDSVHPPTAEYQAAGTPAVLMDRVHKMYGDGFRALAGVSLFVTAGEIFGLLGPAGAGKTTISRILAALLAYDGGRARVFGRDPASQGEEIRGRIGYLGQYGAIGRHLTGLDYVRHMARLRGSSRRDARQESAITLEILDLSALATRRAADYSASEMRRMMLAGAIVGRPKLLVLDAPTEGLQPYERAVIWRQLQRLRRASGITVFLATSRLDEAETVADRIALVDRGRCIAAGTPAELKAQSAGTLVAVHVLQRAQVSDAALLLERMVGVRAVRPQGDRINLEAAGASTVPALLRLLEEHEIAVREVSLSRSSLEDVFFQHTGRKMHDERESAAGSTNPIGQR